MLLPAAGSFTGVTTFTYRADDLLDTITDPLQRVTELVYDDAGRVHEVHVEGVLQGRTWYDVMGRAARTEDALGQVTETTFDARGLVVAVDVPGLPTQTFGYRADGQLHWSEDGDGNAQPANGFAYDVLVHYDSLGRVISTWGPDTIQDTLYDGARVVAQDVRGGGLWARTETEYDAAGRPSRSIQAISTGCAAVAAGRDVLAIEQLCASGEFGVTELGWTAAGRRAALTDPNGNTTSWSYDGLGQVERIASATMEESLRWDPLGRLVESEQGPLGGAPELLLEHRYDAMGRLEHQTWTAGGSTERVSYGYDVVGRTIWSAAERDGVPIAEESIDFDAFDRPVQLARSLFGIQSGNPHNATCDPGEICLDYDDLGRPTGVVYPDGRDVQLSWVPEGLDRACTGAGCGDQDPLYEVAQRDVMGRPTEEWLSGGVFRATLRDARGRPTAIDTDFGTDSITVDQFFDAFGRLEARLTQQTGSLALGDAGGVESWTYNAAGWLTEEVLDQDVWTQEYDVGGNRLSRTNLNTGDEWTATYGPDNRLQTWKDAHGTTSFQYDGLGRRENDLDGRTYTYTPRGRVERAWIGGTQVASYAYGPDGRRVWEATAAGTRDYVYGPGAWLPYVVNTPAGPEDQVLVGGALLGVLGDPGAGTPGAAGSSAIVGDGTGTPLYRSGSAGALDSQTRWDAYGTPIQRGGTALSTTWKQLLPSGPDVGLLAAGARDYDPATGTWMQADPMGVDGGLNVYRYAEGDPINNADPSGYCISADTPDWLLQQQREQAEWQMQAHTDWDIRKGDPARMSMRGLPNYCQIATNGDLIDCGGTPDNFLEKYMSAKWDRSFRNHVSKYKADLRGKYRSPFAEDRRRALAENGLGLSDAYLDDLASTDPTKYQSLLGSVDGLYRALGDAAYFESMADSMPVSSGFGLGDETSPMFAGTGDSGLGWAAGRIGMARRIDFTVPLLVTGGPDPRAKELDKWLRRFGGHDAILMDLESRRGPPESKDVVVFEAPLQVGSLPPEQALALAVATGDKPPPAVMDRAFIDATAQLADINRLAGDYTVGAVAASAPGAYVADWYRLAGLGALVLQTGGSDNAAAELFAKADAINEETFRNTGVEPEHQQVVAAFVDAALGLMGATKAALHSSSGAVRSVPELAGPLGTSRAPVLRLPSSVGAAGRVTLNSRIRDSNYALRLAGRLEGGAQRDVDNLLSQFAAGNHNPGLGTRALGDQFFELRGRNAGRVIVKRISAGTFDIVGKFQGHVRGATANSNTILRLIDEYKRL